MKKRKIMLIKILYIFIPLILIAVPVYSTEEIIQSQSETLNIKGFISEANKYTSEVFDGIDASELLTNAIQGKIDNKTIFNKIINLFGDEIKDTIKIMRKCYCNNCNT
jgi:hypothetical protein